MASFALLYMPGTRYEMEKLARSYIEISPGIIPFGTLEVLTVKSDISKDKNGYFELLGYSSEKLVKPLFHSFDANEPFYSFPF